MKSKRARSFWGWGYEQTREDRDAFGARVSLFFDLLNVASEQRPAVRDLPRFEDVRLRSPRFELAQEVAEFCSASAYDRASHTYGKSFRDIVQGFELRYDNPPDYVAFPTSEKQIEQLFRFCEENRVAVVPFGGGTSVVGGVGITQSQKYKGTITIDLKNFDRVLEVDTESRCARIQGGALGPDLENQLKKWGLTLRHFPQSFEFSTLGGWIATRAGGHYATVKTHIDDFVESVRVLTPKGVIETRRLPASGAGPSPDRLFIGSEGCLGIITEAWLRVQDRPKYKATAIVHFDSFLQGAKAVKAISQSGIYPTNCRLIDGLEAMMNGIGSGLSVLLLEFESAVFNHFDEEINFCLSLCAKFGGQWKEGQQKTRSMDEGKQALSPSNNNSNISTAEQWKGSFLALPYFRDILICYSVISETFETACTWDKFEVFYNGIINNVNNAIAKHCNGKGLITCRFTHVYPDGPAPYFTVLAVGSPGKEVQQWDNIKRAASETILDLGGTCTHHHAVGRDHEPYYSKENPELFLLSLKTVKKTLDPHWILNPDVLFPPLEETLVAPSKL